jgi:hypothetical protein
VVVTSFVSEVPIFQDNRTASDALWRSAFESLLVQQINPSVPAVVGLTSATSMVLPDKTVATRMSHFPSDLYDLRGTSHLTLFCKALLGESGVGQLRKRNNVAQFQGALHSTHFYDLDGFYGAIFGANRMTSERLWFDPQVGQATPQEWDEVETRDASYRDRIFRLASAINLGATLPGIQAASEAITQSAVDIYETHALIDTYGPIGVTLDWTAVQAIGTWNQIEAQSPSPERPTWDEMEHSTIIGRSGIASRSEVVVIPRKDYRLIGIEKGESEARRERSEDELSLIRVLRVLKPANVLVTVDTEGIAVNVDATITGLSSDSNFWEITARTIPRTDLITTKGVDAYPLSPRQQTNDVPYASNRVLPKPPWTVQDSAEWSYASGVVSARGYTFPPEDDDMTQPGDGPLTNDASDQTIIYKDGTRETFGPNRAIMDSRRALAARYASEGILVAHPYSARRGA